MFVGVLYCSIGLGLLGLGLQAVSAKFFYICSMDAPWLDTVRASDTWSYVLICD